ncbi:MULTISPECIES: GntR family transcriptional regulator [Streptomyces]|uniref:GntR family transcriptional regulator n=1 Tax=Streptomyces cacaoi TaxID=1898 RepID=A0A4Y3R5A3_STRCI|nr:MULTISPECIES: GntR family transcriptional regulator [Streptomyces]NNG83690.1 GntR family transcriptional regulator [Streptomyces cacaoi]QHF96049.1 GntR family transcriptional regulator [Streptomyces sp. NHF165]GEB52744.1 GntR family transcriptional regulator [Streptomyces cacaoi]
MHLVLDLDSEVPIYQQIRDRVVEAIADGRLDGGASLPSTRQLAVDLAINFHTVNKAYDLLRREGIIRINRKSGAVVRPDAGQGPAEQEAVADWERRARTLLAEAVVRGIPRDEIVDRVRATLDGFGAGERGG